MSNAVDTSRTLVFGSRHWTDQDMVWTVLDGLYQEFSCGWMTVDARPFTIIEGEAPGADTFARDWAWNSPMHGPLVEPGWDFDLATDIPTACPVELLRFPANWQSYGRAAGPIRNRQMRNEGKPTFGLCFKDGFDHTLMTGGSENMALLLQARDIPIWLMQHV